MTTQSSDPRKDLEASAKLFEIPVDVKDIPAKWVLITYDCPKSEAGDKARGEFLASAKRIGAIMHTESVYLAPWTDRFNSAALDLSAIPEAKVYIWTAETDAETMRELARHYDMMVGKWMDEIDERLESIRGHVFENHNKLASRMIGRTADMCQEMEAIIKNRGSRVLMDRLTQTRLALATIAAGIR